VWEREGEPAKVDGLVLLEKVKQLAAAALLVRHWPSRGARHDVALALSGLLLRNRWEVDGVAAFISAIANGANDEEWRSRMADILSTAQRLAQGGTTTGGIRLAELVGKSVVDKLYRWLSLGQGELQTETVFHLTELGNARRLVALYGNDLHYCYSRKKWLVWDGTRWAVDQVREIDRKAKEMWRQSTKKLARYVTRSNGKFCSSGQNAPKPRQSSGQRSPSLLQNPKLVSCQISSILIRGS
jgi:hypothetical protein